MGKLLAITLLAASLGMTHGLCARAAARKSESNTKYLGAPPEKKPAGDGRDAQPSEPTCSLLTREGPRGGRLEVEGQGFGKAPLVRIAGKVTRMLERTENRIAVQIPRDSDGGKVTVKVGAAEIECGTLTIIGKN